jgi:hypothetical protein
LSHYRANYKKKSVLYESENQYSAKTNVTLKRYKHAVTGYSIPNKQINSMEQRPLSEADSRFAGQEIPNSQNSATGPYPEPDESSPHPHTLFP